MRSPWLLPVVLLAAVPVLGQDDARTRAAREELERELSALTQVAPPRLEILYDPPPGLGFKLVEAQFTLDDVKLVTPAVDGLNQDGPHPIFTAKVPQGRHVLLTRMVFVRAESGFFTYLSDFRWKLETRATFDVSPGVEVRVIARPAQVPNATAEKDKLTLRHDLEGNVVVPADAPPPAVDAGVAAPSGKLEDEADVREGPLATLRLTAAARKKLVAAQVRVAGTDRSVELPATAGTLPGTLQAPAGPTTLEVLAPGYLAQTRTVTTTRDAEMTVAFELVPTPKKRSVKRAGERLELATPLTFDAKKGALGPGAAAVIAEIVDLLVQGAGKKLVVEGHSDSRGDRAELQLRSEAHARAVTAALEAAGVAASRLEAVGLGDAHPVAPNLTPAGRRRNNRVELRLVTP